MRLIGIGTLAGQSSLVAEFDFDPRNKSQVTSSIGSNGDQPAEQESASRSRYDSSSNEIADKLMDRSAKYLKSLVGAPGFEPGASCAQGRRATRLRYAPT
jgi:hypothetical protein